MNNEDKIKEAKTQPEIKINDTTDKPNKNTINDEEGEHFELDIFKIVKVRSRHVTTGVILITLIALAFVCVIIVLFQT